MTDPMQQARELLPCPFCGGEAERIDFGPGDAENEGGSCIACRRCQASGPVEFGFKENFIANWNRRAALRAAPEGPETHYHCADGIQGTLSRLRRYAKQDDNKNSLQGQTMEEAAAFIEHALAARPQGASDA